MFNSYFYVFKVTNIAEKVLANEGITVYVRKQIKKKFRRVRYFEQLEIDGELYMVIGTSYVEKEIRLKVFFLELYAHLKDDNIRPTFKMVEKVIGNSKVKIFKIPKFKWLK
jgi:hypothetical protein